MTVNFSLMHTFYCTNSAFVCKLLVASVDYCSAAAAAAATAAVRVGPTGTCSYVATQRL